MALTTRVCISLRRTSAAIKLEHFTSLSFGLDHMCEELMKYWLSM